MRRELSTGFPLSTADMPEIPFGATRKAESDRNFAADERPSGNGAVLEAATTAAVAKIRKEDRSAQRWNGELRKKREAQAEPTFFSGPADPAFGPGTAKGVHEAAMLSRAPEPGISEVARFRWDSG